VTNRSTKVKDILLFLQKKRRNFAPPARETRSRSGPTPGVLPAKMSMLQCIHNIAQSNCPLEHNQADIETAARVGLAAYALPAKLTIQRIRYYQQGL